MTDDVVTTIQAAGLLGKSKSRIHQLVQAGVLVPVPHAAGTGFRFRRVDVVAYRDQPPPPSRPMKPMDQLSERQRYRRRKQHRDAASS